MPYCEVVNPETGDLLIRLEYYQEFNPKNPLVFDQFAARMPLLRDEVAQGLWATIAFDSISSLEPMARVMSKYVYNSKIDDQRKHFGYATDQLEEIISMAVAGFRCNIVTVCHVDKDKDEVQGTFVYNPAFPGRLRSRIAKDYAEFYHISAGWDDGTKDYFHLLQTRTRGQYAAATQINAPDPCNALYEALWVNWKNSRRPIHTLVYGEAGAGKSTFVATFPKPLLVCLFDAFGKDTPYINAGLASEIQE